MWFKSLLPYHVQLPNFVFPYYKLMKTITASKNSFFQVTTIAVALFSLMAFTSGGKYYGKKIDGKGAVSVTELPKRMEGVQSLKIKLQGKIGAVCQKKGCWMTMDLGNGQTMRIKFKDYAFFVPLDVAGATAVVEGVATKEVVSEAERKHYMEDAGKSKDEIAKVQGEQSTMTFEAEGVLITK